MKSLQPALFRFRHERVADDKRLRRINAGILEERAESQSHESIVPSFVCSRGQGRLLFRGELSAHDLDDVVAVARLHAVANACLHLLDELVD